MKLETILVRAGAEPDPATGALSPPIHLSTTYEHTPDGSPTHEHIYLRESNPTQSRLETALSAIECGTNAVVFASGMAAVSAYMQSLPEGSHVLRHTDVYTHTRVLGTDFLPRWRCEVSHVDMTKPDSIISAMRPDTKLLWMESPSNPGMDIIDIAAAVEIAHSRGALVVVDSTFATPVMQQPLTLGADAVMHSMTKYMGGHSDVQGGALIFRENDRTVGQVKEIRNVTGGVLSPFNAWQILRGLRSLSCRVERHTENALAIAQRLEDHPKVEGVHYPGLSSHPGHEVAKRQMKGFGGMLSFRVKGGAREALAVASKLKLFINATSLGGVESLIEHRYSIEGSGSVTPSNLLRVAVGLEAAEDLIEDLEQALE
ncbi:MAG: PLP-dependent aspartate aminotransferase family protein [Gemmatimonadota bacterium]|nr:PLP-dependent aspartate aminotransferase family protein [Gemmatimonadota bacterium]